MRVHGFGLEHVSAKAGLARGGRSRCWVVLTPRGLGTALCAAAAGHHIPCAEWLGRRGVSAQAVAAIGRPEHFWRGVGDPFWRGMGGSFPVQACRRANTRATLASHASPRRRIGATGRAGAAASQWENSGARPRDVRCCRVTCSARRGRWQGSRQRKDGTAAHRVRFRRPRHSRTEDLALRRAPTYR